MEGTKKMWRHFKTILSILLITAAFYGLGRIYFAVNAGFLERKILVDLSREPPHEVTALQEEDMERVRNILQQPFHYLDRGCQSYVFVSHDEKYVLKILKIYHFRPRAYLQTLSFIPQVEKYFQKKTIEKRTNLNRLLDSWKTAYNELSNETGLVYMHLNRGDRLPNPLIIYDKMGIKHQINPDEVLFLVQRKAEMLCQELRSRMKRGDLKSSQLLIYNLVKLLVSQYERGFGDNDHALRQNTGVIGDQPFHIDVGQLCKSERFKNPIILKQELLRMTDDLRLWLSKRYPQLERYLAKLLLDVTGVDVSPMRPFSETVD